MTQLQLLTTFDGNETYNEKLIKNFYNMMILKYGYVPGEDSYPAISLFVNDVFEGSNDYNNGEENLPESNVKDMKKFYAKMYINYIEKDLHLNQIGDLAPTRFIEFITKTFNKNLHVELNEVVIRKAITILASYHPLIKINYSNLESCLREATIEYKKSMSVDKNVTNIMKALEEQIRFNSSNMKDKKQYELILYKHMLKTDYNQTKEKLLNEFVRGTICRNDNIVSLFYDLYKDEYETEFEIPLYHGVKPRYYTNGFDVERTYNEYSGYTSFSKSKEVAIKFAQNEDVIGWVLETSGVVKGLDVEKMICDSKYSNSDYILENCVNEEEVLIKHPENIIIHKVNEHNIENGFTEFNSIIIDLSNIENNAKCHKRIIDRMYNHNVFIDAKKVRLINYGMLKSDKELDFICNLLKNGKGDELYLINGIDEIHHVKRLKEKGFKLLNEEFNNEVVDSIMLYGYFIHESQVKLFDVDYIDDLGTAM